MSAQHMVDIGPGAGVHGDRIIARHRMILKANH